MTVDEWKQLLRARVRDAMREKDTTALAVLRETLAAIDNAEAPDIGQAPVAESEVIAGAAIGLGAGEIARRALTPEDVTAIVKREIDERRAAAAEYASLGRQAEAEALERQTAVLRSLLGVREVRRGDLFWIASDDVPYAHPYVVLQEDVFNRSRITTVVACALTTNLGKASEPGNVLLDVGEGGLPKQSVVVVSQIDAIEKARLGARIGSLSEARIEQILAGLRFQQASFFER